MGTGRRSQSANSVTETYIVLRETKHRPGGLRVERVGPVLKRLSLACKELLRSVLAATTTSSARTVGGVLKDRSKRLGELGDAIQRLER